MAEAERSETSARLKDLPSIDELLQTSTGKTIAAKAGRALAISLARKAVEELRNSILSPESQDKVSGQGSLTSLAETRMADDLREELRSGVRHVINATGVIIHTNLGRSPLSENAKLAFLNEASHYCTVELDIETGKRGKRGDRAERLICKLTGAEAAIIVNNCAAAAFLVLTAFGTGKEVIISRGELVEIGGDFRVPDVLSRSGAILREVGTTNRTKLRDYENAIGSGSGMILRVHPSNYRVIGFTETPKLSELAKLAKAHGLILFEDAGSGALFDLSEFGLGDEPVISRSIADGADIVCFSGDKLLGGPQAGIIAGKKDLIATLRRDPLYRALRLDKLAYAALEATLDSYLREKQHDEIPVLRMLSMDTEQILNRSLSAVEKIREITGTGLEIDIVQGESVIGGGSAPDVKPITWCITLSSAKKTADELENILRNFDTPVVTRIVDGKVVIDMRTVFEDEEVKLIAAVSSLVK